MKKIFQIILIICGGLVMNSCYYDEIPEAMIPDDTDGPVIPDTQVVSFEDDIQPIFTADCIRCHDGSLNPDLGVGKAYTALVPKYVIAKDPAASRLYIQLKVNNHRNLDAAKIELIKTWIDRGAEDN